MFSQARATAFFESWIDWNDLIFLIYILEGMKRKMMAGTSFVRCILCMDLMMEWRVAGLDWAEVIHTPFVQFDAKVVHWTLTGLAGYLGFVRLVFSSFIFCER